MEEKNKAPIYKPNYDYALKQKATNNNHSTRGKDNKHEAKVTMAMVQYSRLRAGMTT